MITLPLLARDKLREVLNNVLFHRRDRFDTAIRGWGMADEWTAKCMTRVIRKRLRLLAEMGMAQEDAALRARMLMGSLDTVTRYQFSLYLINKISITSIWT